MTVCVGVRREGAVWLGADSLGSSSVARVEHQDRKVFARGDFLIAGAGSFRMIQLLRYVYTPAARDAAQDVMEYLVGTFVEGLRAVYKTSGFAEVHAGLESQNGLFLIAHAGRLFQIEPDYQVAEVGDAFSAIGSGGRVALGALHVLEDGTRDVREVITRAVEISARCTPSVGGPTHVVGMTWDAAGRGRVIGSE